jgi:hypothetical protein
MHGKKGFAPVVLKGAALVVPVTYGVRGYDLALGKPCDTFYQAELKAEELNRALGLSDEEAWLLVENTVMCER